MALTTIPSAGQKLRGSVLSAIITESRPIVAYKTVDEPLTSNATLQNDDALFWSVTASAQYLLDLRIFYSTGATPNIKFGWTFPTGLTMKLGVIGFDTGSALVSNSGYDQTTVIPFGPGTAPTRLVTYVGRIVVSTTAGTLQLQWAQNTSNPGTTTVMAGSHGSLIRVV